MTLADISKGLVYLPVISKKIVFLIFPDVGIRVSEMGRWVAYPELVQNRWN